MQRGARGEEILGIDGAGIVIIGGGIAGVSLAHELCVRRGVRDVALLEPGEPLGLTTAAGTRAYRDWWSSTAMAHLLSHSLERFETLLPAAPEDFGYTRRGYLQVAHSEAGLARLRARAQAVAEQCGLEIRGHVRGSSYRPNLPGTLELGLRGVDFLEGPALREHFPELHPDVRLGIHWRRCGWMDAPRLGRWLLERAEAAGLRRIPLALRELEPLPGDRWRIRLEGGRMLEARQCVLATGPALASQLSRLGTEIGVRHEVHRRAWFSDPTGAFPRHYPLTIWEESVPLPVAGSPPGPTGAHARPLTEEVGGGFWGLWDVRPLERNPLTGPIEPDPDFPADVLHALGEMLPGLRRVAGGCLHRQSVSGYYCKSPDQLPLVGPWKYPGLYLHGCFSGYGLMVSQGAADILARTLVGQALPAWGAGLDPRRFLDPQYLASIPMQGADPGQL